jgi:Ca-activated chloride channel family protein
MFRFAHPAVLLLLIGMIPILYFGLRRGSRERSMAYSSVDLIDAAGLRASWWKRYGRLTLRSLVLVLIVVGLARPQTGRSESTIETEGVDIVLLIDTSSSMQAEDFRPKNRLYVAKEVVKEFISKRKNDRIGLVVFSADAITQCPLTLDYAVLQDLVDHVDFGMLQDGTAIGVALATACNRLKDSRAKSKVVVLLTDGRNNAGMVAPITAAEVAKTLGIKVYTIGVGTSGPVPVPVDNPLFGRRTVSMEMKLDEDTLKKIASLTDGEYFHATDTEQLEKIYEKIDALEKTKIETKTYASYTDKFQWMIVPALVLLFVQIGLAESWLREIP